MINSLTSDTFGRIYILCGYCFLKAFIEYTEFGKTGRTVSRIGIGRNVFCGPIAKDLDGRISLDELHKRYVE